MPRKNFRFSATQKFPVLNKVRVYGFGEFGFGYSRGGFDRDNGVDLGSKQMRWGLAHSGIGLTFYF